jgi:putative transferase (TIGR04331 family)
MCPQAEPYYKDLKKAGILFSNPIKAAKRVNDIFNDAQGWWNQEEIQIARKNWTWQFARTSKNWRREWIKAIRNL